MSLSAWVIPYAARTAIIISWAIRLNREEQSFFLYFCIIHKTSLSKWSKPGQNFNDVSAPPATGRVIATDRRVGMNSEKQNDRTRWQYWSNARANCYRQNSTLTVRHANDLETLHPFEGGCSLITTVLEAAAVWLLKRSS